MTATVYLVDDDPSVLRALVRLISAEGLATIPCDSGAAFLAAHDPAVPGCAIIDLGLPDIGGLDLFFKLQSTAARPVIFLTGQGTIPAAVEAMRGGAVDFLTKPVAAGALLNAIGRALDRDAELRARTASRDTVRTRLASLTHREREVMQEVAQGRLNKQIAHRLGTSEKTIKVHRGRMMHKMEVRSVAELVRLLASLEI